ncbi:MAG: glycosyltransferase [Bacteroidota bacterium]
MSAKRKILILIDWYLPGYKAGGPVRSCANMVAHLKDDFDFYVITGNKDYSDVQPYQGVNMGQWNLLPDGTQVYYLPEAEQNAAALRKLVRSGQFDAILLNGVFSRLFTIAPLRFLSREEKKKVILSVRGMLSPQALAIKKLKKRLFLAYARLRGLYSGITFHITDRSEEGQVKKYFGASCKIRLAPNLGRKSAGSGQALKSKSAQALELVCVARIAPEKNQLFALNVLRGVQQPVILDLYGPVYNPVYWNECQGAIKRLPAHISVNYKGALPENRIYDTLGQYHFLFMPSVSENFGHIILESLTSGTPVIISDQTPWKGLEAAKAGFDVSLSDPERFRSIIERAALMNAEEYLLWSQGASALAAKFNADPGVVRLNRDLFI